MIPLARVPGIQPDLSIFLRDAAIHTANDLAQADALGLQHEITMIARKCGKASAIPSVVNVKLWIQAARETVANSKPLNMDEIPEAVSLEDIPEAQIDFDSIPEAEPVVSQNNTELQSGDAVPNPSAQRFPVPERLQQADDGSWGGIDRRRLQTLEDYAANERGIQPLRRNANAASPSPAKLPVNSEGKSSRLTRKGVLYPFPMLAILGAFICLLWRLALLATMLVLPVLLILHHDSEERPVTLTLYWLGIFFFIGLLQIWVISRVRCRVCSCELFLSKRCFKNRRAHLIKGFGYVASLSLHLLLFQWFRCMYCGTAIRLFGGRSREAKEAIMQEDGDDLAME